jgi:glutamine synthetase
VLEWQARGDLDGHASWRMPADGDGTRVEVRCPDGSSNTYLAFAVILVIVGIAFDLVRRK